MVYGMDRIGTRHAISPSAKHVVAYLHRSCTNSQLKQAVLSIGRASTNKLLDPNNAF